MWESAYGVSRKTLRPTSTFPTRVHRTTFHLLQHNVGCVWRGFPQIYWIYYGRCKAQRGTRSCSRRRWGWWKRQERQERQKGQKKEVRIKCVHFYFQIIVIYSYAQKHALSNHPLIKKWRILLSKKYFNNFKQFIQIKFGAL